jgi:MFS family permease
MRAPCTFEDSLSYLLASACTSVGGQGPRRGSSSSASVQDGAVRTRRPRRRLLVANYWCGCRTPALLLLGTALAGLGFGPANLGAYRVITARADPTDRAALIAAISTVQYLAFGLPALLAGIATAHFGLHDTALVYSVVIALLAAAAAGRPPVRGQCPHPPTPAQWRRLPNCRRARAPCRPAEAPPRTEAPFPSTSTSMPDTPVHAPEADGGRASVPFRGNPSVRGQDARQCAVLTSDG